MAAGVASWRKRWRVWAAVLALAWSGQVPASGPPGQGPELQGAPLPEATASAPAPLHPRSLAAGVLLVASPNLGDPRFRRTVVLVLDHGPDGAMGVVLNRGSGHTLAEALPGVPGIQREDKPLRIGGPVGTERVILVMEAVSAPAESMEVLEGVYASSSRDALRQVLEGQGPVARYRAFAGYAGWASGQLEREVERGDWHLFPATGALVFDGDPADLWGRLIGRAQGRWVRAPGPLGGLPPGAGPVSAKGVPHRRGRGGPQATGGRTYGHGGWLPGPALSGHGPAVARAGS